ncbi:MAG: hypothetical protein U0Q55_21255 [Vicinamibacterales bacterium]
MEPLKPDQKLRILADRPLAAPEEIEEYERLLSERFRQEPLTAEPDNAAALGVGPDREARLRELHQKLFG